MDMKKLLAVSLTIMILGTLGGCGKQDTQEPPKVKIDYGNSELYTQEDMDRLMTYIIPETRHAGWTSSCSPKVTRQMKWTNLKPIANFSRKACSAFLLTKKIKVYLTSELFLLLHKNPVSIFPVNTSGRILY